VINRGLAGYNSRWALKAFNQLLAEVAASGGGQQVNMNYRFWVLPDEGLNLNLIRVPAALNQLMADVAAGRGAQQVNINCRVWVAFQGLGSIWV
jgi:hypothetical protein